MNAVDLLNREVELANTAHQREVKDLIAAGLNPVLSANTRGADTPSLSGYASMIGSSGSGSGGSARSAIKLAKLNPQNKALDTANNAISQLGDIAKKMSYNEYIRTVHPERITSANKAAEENQRKLLQDYARRHPAQPIPVNQNTNTNDNPDSVSVSNDNSGRSLWRSFSYVAGWPFSSILNNMSNEDLSSIANFISLFNGKLGNFLKNTVKNRK